MNATQDRVRHLHTLGPHGTNLEAASHEWLRRQSIEGMVNLHASLESALEAVPDDGEHAITACAVYPDLHTLVFGNLHGCASSTPSSGRPATWCSPAKA